MRRVVRIAAYIPAATEQGVPVGAFDEDEFTLGATAVERAWAGRREEPGEVAIHLLGEFPPAAEWGFPALLGRVGEVTRHSGRASELVTAIRSLEAGDGGPAFVVAVDLPERGAKRAANASGHGAAAVAFLLEPSEEASEFPLAKSAGGRSAVGATLRLGESSKGLPRSATLVGDWDRASGVGRLSAPSIPPKSAKAVLSSVSEGAYVPRARYLENLPSRWRFLAEVCGACHGTTFPARGTCRHCGRAGSLTSLQLPHDGGRVVAVTTVGKGGQPTEFDAQVEELGPYEVALVELARGMRVTLQVTDSVPGKLTVGDRVNTLLRRLYPMEGEWRYGRKAVPVASPEGASSPP